jgi:hypothetical protein
LTNQRATFMGLALIAAAIFIPIESMFQQIGLFSPRYTISGGGPNEAWRINEMTGQVSYCLSQPDSKTFERFEYKLRERKMGYLTEAQRTTRATNDGELFKIGCTPWSEM